MPNLYFTRDPFATIGHGITLNRMKTDVRNRETIFAKYIFENHPRFKDLEVPVWFDRKEMYALEGGDIIVFNPKIIAVGISARTDAAAIEKFSERVYTLMNTSKQSLPLISQRKELLCILILYLQWLIMKSLRFTLKLKII